VATLNVKNLPDPLYRKLRKRARARHRSLAQEVTQILGEAVDEAEPVSLLELRGLGRDLWRDGDAARHVEKERRSWD
jgi:plasmid stability protein